MPDRLCPGLKGDPKACGAPLLPHKQLCPACRARARRAANAKANRDYRARKKAKEKADARSAE